MLGAWCCRRRARQRLGLLAVVAACAAGPSLGAWEGHDWNRWRQVTSWQKPQLHTHQAGRRDLAPLLGGDAADASRIVSVSGWGERRQETARALELMLGQPIGLKPPEVEVRELGVEQLEGYSRRHLEIRSEAEDWIPAYLLTPAKPAAARLPAMLCLHQTVAQGKDEPCGLRGNPELAFAVELVRRGYVCLAPDVIGFGERIPPGTQPYHDSLAFYRRHPGWSFLGKMVWDLGRVIDYLETLPFVDPKRIGSIGHSHGAYGTLFAAALEPRISLAIASCGFTTFRRDPTPERWSHLTALMPQLGLYLPDVAAIPFDWQDVCALVAPRPLLVWYATRDPIFPETDNLDGLFKDVRGVYELYGKGEALAWQAFEGPHRFPIAAREAAYQWLERQWSFSGRTSGAASSVPASPPLAGVLSNAPSAGPSQVKTASAFFPRVVRAQALTNAVRYPWAAAIRDSLVAAAAPWLKLSDEELWALMFGQTIRRSWMVWSNGHCPACQKPVPMYEWRMDALERPWKVQCPKCKELFPKNDFQKFYASGLDERGVFDPARADRRLLFNTEHPEASDPSRLFGVDDGEGYTADGKRWRFIGTYLIYGQWKQAIVNGIRDLAAAFLATGKEEYAHKAGVLLDRVADLYPEFDFGKEGVLYEGPARSGYVSTWHDACVEVHDLALAYDAVFEALARDEALVRFLAGKAAQHKLANPKASFADVQRNVEERILRDTLAHRPKIESNYPSTDVTLLAIQTVLGWPGNRAEVTAALDRIIARATAVDGLSGEKGIAGYSIIAPRNVAELIGRYARLEPGGVENALRRHPRLHAMFRFHLDTWCLGQYYPRTGDTGSFAEKTAYYAALGFTKNPGTGPSSFAFLWDLYQATGDADFVRLLYTANGSSVEGLPYDLFAAEPASLQQGVARVIAHSGAEVRLGSVNKTEWGLAILRSGEGVNARAAWLDYDSGERHGHADAMNLGLFAKGLDLLPDFGYPPVQFGGWQAPRAVWYTQTAAHNTVQVDGQNTRPGTGKTSLWFDGKEYHVVRASAPQLIGGPTYERTVALIDLSPENFYLIDVFQVAGGKEHIKYFHSHFGRVSSQGLKLEPALESRFGEVMRGFQRDARPAVPWSVDWTIDDRLKYLPAPKDLHLRYTDLTPDAEAQLAEGWVSVGSFGGTDESWIPRVLVCRRSEQAPLASTFVSLIEPYEGKAGIAGARRLELRGPDGRGSPGHVGVEVRLADGQSDLFVALAADPTASKAAPGEAPMSAECTLANGARLRLEGELCLVRCGPDTKPKKLLLCHSRSLRFGELFVQSKRPQAAFEINLEPTNAPVVTGRAEELELLEFGGVRLWPK